MAKKKQRPKYGNPAKAAQAKAGTPKLPSLNKPSPDPVPSATTTPRTPFFKGAAVTLIILAMIGSILGVAGLTAPQPQDKEAKPSTVPSVPQPPAATSAIVRGSTDAPITVDVVSDFECAECAEFDKFYGESLAVLADVGDIKVNYHMSANYGVGSVRATIVAACAHEFDLFTQVSKQFFKRQQKLSSRSWDLEQLQKIAVKQGAPAKQLDECVNSGRYATLADASTVEAQKSGVFNIPALFVNGDNVEAGEYFDAVQEAINNTAPQTK